MITTPTLNPTLESLQKADRVMPEEVANRLAESALDAASQVSVWGLKGRVSLGKGRASISIANWLSES